MTVDYQLWGMGATMLTAIVVTGSQNNARIGALEKVMDARNDAMKERFDRIDRTQTELRSELMQRIDRVQMSVSRFGEENARHDERLDAHAARLDAIERSK